MENLTSCAVIFCGGRGSRLGSIGEKKNKSLLLVKNKPIIGHIIDQLLKAKIDKIILPLGYRGKDIKKYITKSFSNEISKFTFVTTGINSEISSRIIQIKKYLPSNKSVLFINGDTIFNFNLLNFFKSHIKSKQKISLATFSPKIDLGLIEINKNKSLKFKKSVFLENFQSKIHKYCAYSGFAIMESNYLKKFKFTSHIDFEFDIFNKAMKLKNVNIYNIKNDICFPIDNIKSLKYANEILILKN